VAQEILNRAQVGARLQQMRRERVAECVRADAARDRRLSDVAADDAIDAARGETAAAKIQEERLPSARLTDGGRRVPRRPPGHRSATRDVLEHRPNRLPRWPVERHEPLLPALASHAYDPARQVHVFQIEVDKLAQPQA